MSQDSEKRIPRFVPSAPDPTKMLAWQAASIGVAVVFVVGGLIMAVVFAVTSGNRADHWRGVICAEMLTASADQIYVDYRHLDGGATASAAYAYAVDLGQFGRNALVTQKALDSLARACAA